MINIFPFISPLFPGSSKLLFSQDTYLVQKVLFECIVYIDIQIYQLNQGKPASLYLPWGNSFFMNTFITIFTSTIMFVAMCKIVQIAFWCCKHAIFQHQPIWWYEVDAIINILDFNGHFITIFDSLWYSQPKLNVVEHHVDPHMICGVGCVFCNPRYFSVHTVSKALLLDAVLNTPNCSYKALAIYLFMI